MSNWVVPATVLRDRPEGEDVEVGPVELFFDLVYVFTIIQISHHLLEHLSWTGAAETAVLFLAVWWAWNYTAWAMNWISPDSAQVRLLTGLLMVAGLGMAVSLPHAFEDQAVLFAGSYVTLQVVRSTFMVAAFRGRDPVMQRNYTQLLAWSCLAGVAWIAGAFLDEQARLLVWVVAVAVDYAAPSVGFALPGLGRTPMDSWTLRAEHLAERNRLVFIIALGETILIMGGTLSDIELTSGAVAATILGYGLLFLLWWNYFNPSIAHIERRGHTTEGRSAYAYAHAAMVAGAIVIAVAIELLVAHPTGHVDLPTILTLFVGSLLYLAGNVRHLATHLGHPPPNRATAAGVLVLAAAILAPTRDHVPPLLALGVVIGVMAGVAVTSRAKPLDAK